MNDNDKVIERFKKSRELLSNDPYRPLYHFSAPEGKLNDPNGFCQWNGNYHLFYQFVSEKEQGWHWGHAYSQDLIFWNDLEQAIAPGDEIRAFSGQTIVEEHRVIAMYHGGFGNSIAISSDPLLRKWEKSLSNPVIPIIPIDEKMKPYRVFDPCIWKEDDGYYSLSGTFIDGENLINCKNIEHIFHSKDLDHWEYKGIMLEDGFYTEPGEDGAVPNFLPIGKGLHLLLFFSHKRASQYYIGHYDKEIHRFTPISHGRMNYGPVLRGSLHASSAFIDNKGRLLAIFNVKEGKKNGNSLSMTLPRVLSIGEDHTLEVNPIEEVRKLRCNHTRINDLLIEANSDINLNEVRGKSIEIRATIDPGDARELGFWVLSSENRMEGTRISYYSNANGRTGEGALQIDVSESSLACSVLARTPETGPLQLQPGEKLEMSIFIDRSIIEVFANGRQCLTIRAYPTKEDSRSVRFFSRGSGCRILSLDCWQMRSIWPELKKYEGD